MFRLLPYCRTLAFLACFLTAALTARLCPAEIVHLLAAGDVTLAGGMAVQPPSRLFTPAVSQRIAQAHAFLWNCEVSGPSSVTKPNQYIFLTDGALFSHFAFPNGVALTANNHVFDGYQEGAAALMELLSAAGITQHGLYNRHEGYAALRLKGIEGPAVYLLTGSPMSQIGSGPEIFTPGYPRLRDEVAHLRASEPGSTIIIYSHDGTEGQSEPSPRQRIWARAFAQAGADVILFSHSHHYGDIESLPDSPRQTLVVWGLGNFLFGGNWQWKDRADVRLLALRLDTLSGEKSAHWLYGQTRNWLFSLRPEPHSPRTLAERTPIVPAATRPSAPRALPPQPQGPGRQPPQSPVLQPVGSLPALPLPEHILPDLPLPQKLSAPLPAGYRPIGAP